MDIEKKQIPPPQLVCISVGSLCGYNCIFCSNPHIPTVIQSLDNITKILENFRNAEIIDISGFGELLIHPEFEQIIHLMTENKTPFSFITTGEDLTPDKQELLRNSSLKRMNFSLNSLNPETKKMLSGNKGNFEKVMNHFKSFVKKPRTYTVSISMVVCQYTFKEMPDFVRFGIEHGIETVVFHELHKRKYPDGLELSYNDEEWKYFDEAHHIGVENNMVVSGFSRRGVGGKLVKRPIKECRAPWDQVVVAPDGKVIPCVISSTGYEIGNINTQSFDEMWNGKKANELRNALLSGDDKFCKLCILFE